MTREKTDTKPDDTISSGDVHANSNLGNIDNPLTRAELGHSIRTILEEKGFKQREIADLLKIDQAEVSKLMNARYDLFSEKRLLNFLDKLDRKISIQIKEKKLRKSTTKSTFSELEKQSMQEAFKRMQMLNDVLTPSYLKTLQESQKLFKQIDVSAASQLQREFDTVLRPFYKNQTFQDSFKQMKLIQDAIQPHVMNELEITKSFFKNFDVGAVSQLQEAVQALAAPFNNIQDVISSYSNYIAEMNRGMSSIVEGLNLKAVEIEKYISDPLTKALESYQDVFRDPLKDLFPKGLFGQIALQQEFIEDCRAKGWVPHPLFYWFFGADFFALSDTEQEQKIKENWGEFSSSLWERLPENLMENGRKERLKQIYDAQNGGAYTPVCRSVYPEIESLAYEYLRSDTAFVESLKKLPKSEKKRTVNEKINTLLKMEQSPILDLYITELGGLLGFRTIEILLTNTRAEFIPFDETGDDFSMNRHFHAHGIPFNATFKDSLNALLLLDTALQGFSALKNGADDQE